MENQFRKLEDKQLITCYSEYMEMEKTNSFSASSCLLNEIKELYIKEYPTMPLIALALDLFRACTERWYNKSK